MSAMSRFGPSVAKTLMVQQHRQMASAVNAQSDPIQRLFIEKIRDFKTSSKGLDGTHEKLMNDEMKRLKRVYKVDENKLAHIDSKFSSETQVSLHDLDTSKELRQQIYSGEYQRQLSAKSVVRSELLESIPYREPDGFHLPLINKPNKLIILESMKAETIPPPELGSPIADYEIVGDKVTPESLQRDMGVVFGDKMPTVDDDKSPERDLVNFPRQPIPLDTPPTVGHIIPLSWFKFFYPKTGVSGPYVFALSFGTFLFSKELLVMEHELISGLSLIPLYMWAIPKFGPKISEYVRKKLKTKLDNWDNWRTGSIETLNKIQNSFNDELKKGDMLDELYAARRQDVDLQVEGEYRQRLKNVYDETKRRLDYLVAVANSKRQIGQANMVNWVITNVHSSIGPKLEEEFLNSCLVNLKQLAQKNANAI